MSKRLKPSLTRKLFNMALEIGDDIIDLTLGDPDVLPHEEIRKAACEAIIEGKTRYSANAGLIELRRAYAAFFKKQYGILPNPEDNVIITVGGMEALFLAISSIVDMGDEVIILAPYYVNYCEMLNMCGGKARIIDRLNKTDDELLSQIEKNITDKTVAVIVNSPCNPVGDMLTERVLDGIARIANENDIFVISDDVYSSLVYDDKSFDSIVSREGMFERTILIDSCSKRFAMTGWRVGCAVAPREIITAMTKMQENVAACTPLPSQYAAIRAYSGDFDYSYIKKEYEKRRNIVFERLNMISNLSPIYPEATFYCFVDISKTGLDAESFAYKLLKEKHVAVVPGNAYGEKYTNYIRIAFTLKESLLEIAMDRIRDFCESISVI